MGPKSKKPKALTPEEIAAKEEEARKLKELEEKRLAEEQRLRELEEARIQAERKAIREEEYARLVVELEERGKLISASNEKREEVEAIQKAEEEWEKFRETDDDCIAITQKELNTFCAICDESKVKSLREALDIVQKIETVATDVKNYWADCLASNNIQEQKQCVSYLIHFNRTIMDLLDTGTAYILKDPPSVGGDRDLHLEEVASGVMIGLWGCLMERPGNRKSVQFEKCGVQLDIPKQVFSAGRLVHRVIRTPLETFNLFPYDNSTIIDGEKTLVTNDKIVVGDLYIMEILHPPKESHHIVSLKWCMKDNSKATYMIHRSPYPSSVPIRCFIKVPDTVVMSNDIRIAVWDEENNEFTEEGVTEFQYSESTRMVQFHITVLGTFALVRNRTAHFPYKRFNISPFRDLRQMDYYEKMVRVNIVAGNVDVTIGVTGPNCFIAKTTSKPLLDIINKHMSPGKLLYELQKRGVNLLPTALDLTSATLDVMKVCLVCTTVGLCIMHEHQCICTYIGCTI